MQSETSKLQSIFHDLYAFIAVEYREKFLDIFRKIDSGDPVPLNLTLTYATDCESFHISWEIY